jgi:hypothetical protein
MKIGSSDNNRTVAVWTIGKVGRSHEAALHGQSLIRTHNQSRRGREETRRREEGDNGRGEEGQCYMHAIW